MFERFTRETRATVLRAVAEAERTGAGEIRNRHLLAALGGVPARGRAGRMLAELGLSGPVLPDLADAFAAAERRGGLSNADVSALREIGIDVDQVVDRVEQAWGPNALAPRRIRPRRRLHRGGARFADEAKRTLELTLRQALELGDRHIGDEHLLLALLAGHDVVAEALAERGATYPRARALLSQLAAAG